MEAVDSSETGETTKAVSRVPAFRIRPVGFVRPKGRPNEGHHYKTFNNTQNSQLSVRIAEVSRSPDTRVRSEENSDTEMNVDDEAVTGTNTFGENEQICFEISGCKITSVDVHDIRNNRTIRPHVLDAMGSLMKKRFGANVSGFVDIATMRSAEFHGLDKSLRCVQLLTTFNNHIIGRYCGACTMLQ